MKCKWCGSTQDLLTTINLLNLSTEVICPECDHDIQQATPISVLDEQLWKE